MGQKKRQMAMFEIVLSRAVKVCQLKLPVILSFLHHSFLEDRAGVKLKKRRHICVKVLYCSPIA
jgi:hypothetical protein